MIASLETVRTHLHIVQFFFDESVSRFLCDHIRQQNCSICTKYVCVCVIYEFYLGFFGSTCSFVVVDAANGTENIVEGVACKVARHYLRPRLNPKDSTRLRLDFPSPLILVEQH